MPGILEREQILQLLRERIVAFAASRDRGDRAEDVAQEVLRLLHEKYPQVTGMHELVPLALKIARFVILGVRRKELRRGETSQLPVDDLPLPDSRHHPGDMLMSKEAVQRLAAAINRLGERCRQLIRYKLQGKSFAEMQVLFRAPAINTIYTWDHRCRKQLLEALGGSWTLERER